MGWGQPDRRPGPAVATPTAVSWMQLPALNLGPAVNAAGESHYQDALEAVAGGRTAFGVCIPLITAELVREPANPYDPNAVRVEADGRQLGYVAKEDAPRFHAVIDKLAAQDRPATCRARLTGGWDRGQLDRGTIGLQLLTGRRPTLWNGRAAFLPATPYHENHQVHLLPGLPAEAWPRDKAMVTLADAGAGALALRHGEIWLGHITGRPDLATYIGRIVTAGLPPTGAGPCPAGPPPRPAGRPGRHDRAAVPTRHRRSAGHPSSAHPDRPVGLPAVRTPLAELPPSGSPLVRPGRRRRPTRLPELLLLLAHPPHVAARSTRPRPRAWKAPRDCSGWADPTGRQAWARTVVVRG